MKKLLAVFIIFTLLLGSTAIVSASSKPKKIPVASSETLTTVDAKEIPVVLSETPATVKVGETVSLKAVSEKHGSSYSDSWDKATGGNTIFDTATGCYISEAVFNADKPGTYTISYVIMMDAGSSETEFIGRVERTIEVIGAPTFEVKVENLQLSTSGRISFVINQVWSDGRIIWLGSKSFFFDTNETSRDFSVLIDNNIWGTVTINSDLTWSVKANNP
jgi:hypothetical protein